MKFAKYLAGLGIGLATIYGAYKINNNFTTKAMNQKPIQLEELVQPKKIDFNREDFIVKLNQTTKNKTTIKNRRKNVTLAIKEDLINHRHKKLSYQEAILLYSDISEILKENKDDYDSHFINQIDLDLDGNQELMVSRSYNNRSINDLYIFTINDGTYVANYYESRSKIHSVEPKKVMDLNNDGTLEIVIDHSYGKNLAAGYLTVISYNKNKFSEIAKIEHMGGIKIVDFDDDNIFEIIADQSNFDKPTKYDLYKWNGKTYNKIQSLKLDKNFKIIENEH